MSKEVKRWITVNGAHVPIYEGEDEYDAYDRFDEMHEAKLKQEAAERKKKFKTASGGRINESKYKNINPGYKKDASIYDKEGRNNNCVKCALAFEANMRGEDTEANAFRFGNSEDIEKSTHPEKAFGLRPGDLWDVGRSNRDATIEQIQFLMEDFGSGSRAILQSWTVGQKHAFNVVNDNGKLVFIDPLSGEAGTAQQIMKGVATKSLRLIRTDDQKMSEEYMKWAYKSRR